jgi:glucose-6-phosphate isomerase
MNPSFAQVDWLDGSIDVPGLQSSVKRLSQLKGIFLDEESFAQMDPETVVYRIWWWEPVALGTEGGLLWGTSEISPGKVGNEYFMTHGHRHSILNRAEFYGTVAGRGMLVLRDEGQPPRYEDMSAGSLHYIPGHIMHRVVNVGDAPLRFIACWPSDAGHDYAVVSSRGFGARVVEKSGEPVFVTQESRE